MKPFRIRLAAVLVAAAFAQGAAGADFLDTYRLAKQNDAVFAASRAQLEAGIEKLPQMCVQFRPAELECFLAVKAAFDAKTLLNPGKGVPTLSRCAEFGKVHVHHGRLPHPELPRF